MVALLDAAPLRFIRNSSEPHVAGSVRAAYVNITFVADGVALLVNLVLRDEEAE
jgi:hypothetical protein